MLDELDRESASLFASGRTGDELLARIRSIDDRRVAAARPVFPAVDAPSMSDPDAHDLIHRFRATRDAHRGAVAAPSSALPGPPEQIATAIMVALASLEGRVGKREARAESRQLAADLVDLQGFRPDHEAQILLAAPPDSHDRRLLTTARAAIMQWIRDDPSVIGNVTAIQSLDIRIGDGRRALDAVEAHRAAKLRTLLGIVIVAAVGIAAIIVVVAVLVLT